MPVKPIAGRVAGLVIAAALAAVFSAAPAVADGGGTGGNGGGGGGGVGVGGGNNSGQITIQVSIPAATVSCMDSGGTAEPTNPTLHAGDKLTCKLSGFAANEQVAVTLDGPSAGSVTMGPDATATFLFTVPGSLAVGPHTLTFTGQSSKITGIFPFMFAAVIAGEGAGGTGGTGGHTGPLAFTGVDAAELIGAGLALLAAGTVFTVGARRRRRTG